MALPKPQQASLFGAPPSPGPPGPRTLALQGVGREPARVIQSGPEAVRTEKNPANALAHPRRDRRPVACLHLGMQDDRAVNGPACDELARSPVPRPARVGERGPPTCASPGPASRLTRHVVPRNTVGMTSPSPEAASARNAVQRPDLAAASHRPSSKASGGGAALAGGQGVTRVSRAAASIVSFRQKSK